MDSLEKDTTNLLEQYKTITNKINNFKGAESYIIETIQRVANLPDKMERMPVTLKDVSRLLTKIAFNMI